MRSPLAALHNQMVEVRALNDTLYRGTLVEVTETAILLRSESGWIEIPMQKVVSVEKYTPPAPRRKNP